jgi:hypothetical protein
MSLEQKPSGRFNKSLRKVQAAQAEARSLAIRDYAVRVRTPPPATEARHYPPPGTMRNEDRVFAEFPPRVEYELTPLGLSLRSPIDAITDWAEEHLGEIVSARESAP